MTARIFSVIGTLDIEVDCPRHGTFVTRSARVAELLAYVHDHCRAAHRYAGHEDGDVGVTA
jgi:hypothetical protein